MSEVTTQAGASGAGEGGGEPTPNAPSGESGTETSGADSFAQERAQLEAQRAEWQARHDRAQAEIARLKAEPPAPAAPTGEFLTKDAFREELRRQRQIDAAVESLKQEFPAASDVFDKVDEFDSVEQLRTAAENSQKRFESQLQPHVDSAVEAALAPYIEKFGRIQGPPTGGTEGAGNGLPTWEEVDRMSVSELVALEKEHPGLYDRLLKEQLTR